MADVSVEKGISLGEGRLEIDQFSCVKNLTLDAVSGSYSGVIIDDDGLEASFQNIKTISVNNVVIPWPDYIGVRPEAKPAKDGIDRGIAKFEFSDSSSLKLGNNIEKLTSVLSNDAFSPCYTPGTLIKTIYGETAVEDIEVGDKVFTRDNGFQVVRWKGVRTLDVDDLANTPDLQPIRIARNALGDNVPERDMRVSPQHRMLWDMKSETGTQEVLVAATHLTGLDGIDVVDVDTVTYIHIMFDTHEIICADGAWSESFQPNELSLNSLDDAVSQELLKLYPELAMGISDLYYPAARRTLNQTAFSNTITTL